MSNACPCINQFSSSNIYSLEATPCEFQLFNNYTTAFQNGSIYFQANCDGYINFSFTNDSQFGGAVKVNGSNILVWTNIDLSGNLAAPYAISNGDTIAILIGSGGNAIHGAFDFHGYLTFLANTPTPLPTDPTPTPTFTTTPAPTGPSPTPTPSPTTPATNCIQISSQNLFTDPSPTPTGTATPTLTPSPNGKNLWLWGDNSYGQLGDGTTVFRSSPVQTLKTGPIWNEVDIGSYHAGAIDIYSSLWLWGRNNNGQIGNGTVINNSSPVQVSGVWNYISCGCDASGAINNLGQLFLWGNNSFGQLGTQNTVSSSSPVQTVSGGSTWTSISVGCTHAAATKSDNSLWLWGNNSYGQIGINSVTYTSSPIQTVFATNDWFSVSSGYGYTLALKTDGSVWGWGLNDQGQLGSLNYINYSTPVQIAGQYSAWQGISAGGNFAIAFGNLQDFLTPSPTPSPTSTPTNSPTPTTTTSPTPSATLIASPTPTPSASVASSPTPTSTAFPSPTPSPTSGKLYLWGSNVEGQLGNDSVIQVNFPSEIYGDGTDWIFGAVGGKQGGAIKTDGSLYMWGQNDKGQLASNNTVNFSVPSQIISSNKEWFAVFCGKKFSGGLENTYLFITPTPSPTNSLSPTPTPTPTPT